MADLAESPPPPHCRGPCCHVYRAGRAGDTHQEQKQMARTLWVGHTEGAKEERGISRTRVKSSQGWAGRQGGRKALGEDHSHTEEEPDLQAGRRQDEVRTDAVLMCLQVADLLPRTANGQSRERTDSRVSHRWNKAGFL